MLPKSLVQPIITEEFSLLQGNRRGASKNLAPCDVKQESVWHFSQTSGFEKSSSHLHPVPFASFFHTWLRTYRRRGRIIYIHTQGALSRKRSNKVINKIERWWWWRSMYHFRECHPQQPCNSRLVFWYQQRLEQQQCRSIYHYRLLYIPRAFLNTAGFALHLCQ